MWWIAVVTYRVADPRRVVSRTEDGRQALYREVQLVLRAVVGARELDSFLTDMKELMNKVTEAKKAAEANLISRREETAAMRSQANTARVLSDNPVLMRLRELEVLERIASAGKLSVIPGERGPTDKGLADKFVSLL